MDTSLAVGAAGSLMVGITGSLHCLVMCGPLACATLPLMKRPAGSPPNAGVASTIAASSASGSREHTVGTQPRASQDEAATLALARERRRIIVAYQAARVGSYTLVGALFGVVGGGVTQALAVSTRPWLPWIMAAALIASAFELGKRLRPLPGLSHLSRAIARTAAKFSPASRAGALGAVTPLLPCGLLYGVMATALASGSMAGGALIAGAFALGGLPALLGAQVGRALWKGGSHRTISFALQRAVPLCAAAVLIYRAVSVSTRCH